MYPPKVIYSTVEEYRAHYEEYYCKVPIITIDGIKIFFPKDAFDHAFFESSDWQGAKDVFSKIRAERINWITATLQNPNAMMYQGWDGFNKRYVPDRRVSVVYEDFVVIIGLSLSRKGELKGNFITCYQADNSIRKIKTSPHWNKDLCIKKLQR